MTLKEINAKLPQVEELIGDLLKPGTYLFFTDYDDTETNCLNIKDINKVEYQDGIISFYYGEDNEISAMGSIYVITI